MSSKKTKIKSAKFRLLIIIVACICLIGLLLFMIRLCFRKDYYIVEERNGRIEATKNALSDEFDVVGWLRVQGTNIDYPVISSLNDNYPVTLEKYVWIDTGDNKYHNVVNIYGHNIMNLGRNPKKKGNTFNRFEELMAFVYYDFAKDNKYIQLTMDGHDYLYQIFAAGIIENYYFDIMPIKEFTKDEKTGYIKLMNSHSIYDYGIKVNEDDSFITLVTCTRIYGSSYDDMYVAGRLIDSDKKATNYSIKKNKNYKKIDSVLKGDEEDEVDEA